jgi:hypothetical protein
MLIFFVSRLPMMAGRVRYWQSTPAVSSDSDNGACTCSAPGCNNSARLCCPKCIELGCKSALSFFCGQTCFTKNWKSHKLLHGHASQPAAADPLAEAYALHTRLTTQAHGFAGVGKFSFNSPESDLLIASAANIQEQICETDSFEPPSELPVFALLSPFHQLELISQVIIGLIDPRTPLPPDTPAHHSVFFALFSNALTKIESEIENSLQDEWWKDGPKMTKEELQKRADELIAIGSMANVSDQKNHRRALKNLKDPSPSQPQPPLDEVSEALSCVERLQV